MLLLLPSATTTAQIGKLKTMKAMKASLHITTPFALISPNQLLNAITLGNYNSSTLSIDYYLYFTLSLFSKLFCFVIAGDKYFGFKYSKDKSIVMKMVATGLGKGGGLLEKPPTIETTSPGRESEFDLR